MSTNDSLGDRMKGYEAVSQIKLLRRTPTIIRVDGNAFHTFTKRFKGVDADPFSLKLHTVMTRTALTLCKAIQNVRFAYTQSDEISLFLRDWDKLTTDQWFDARVQKMCSMSAAKATSHFNYHLREVMGWEFGNVSELPEFDSRVYNLPKEEVCNYFIWRQQDASRNSVQMLGRYYFSSKQMHGKNNNTIQDMLMEKHSVNWNNISTWMRRGSCVHLMPYDQQHDVWAIDDEIPIFTQDRKYIERHLVPESGE